MTETAWIFAAQGHDDRSSSRSERDAAPLRKKSILVADSDQLHLAYVAVMLMSEGYSVSVASSGDEAFARIRAGGIDLVVTSVTLPGMDSIELLRKLQDAALMVPVVVVAPGMTEIDGVYLRGAMLFGAARTFSQPLTPPVFLESIRELLKSASS
ncbi:MAG: response regulator [Rhizomicrobium sp.]|jgi:CheY-like chemotaxis protein